MGWRREPKRVRSDSGAGRRLRLAAALLCVALVAGGCGRSPRARALQYVDDLSQFDYARCYRLLSRRDRAERTPQEFLSEIPLAPDVSPVWFRPILHATRYALGQEHRDPGGRTAFVPVLITGPDLVAWERALDASAEAGESGGENARRSLDTGEYPKRSWEDRIYLIKESHHWRVRAGFSERDPLIERHRAALVDFHRGCIDQAIADYQSIIAELERQPATGSLGLAARYRTELAEIQRVRADEPAEKAYAAKMKLSGVAMKMSEDRAPGIFGHIANGGDNAVDDVLLAVTWYEGHGKDLKPVYREEHPVVLTPIEFTDFNDQAIPFAPGESRRFGFLLTAPVDIQRTASPYVTIASIAFRQIGGTLPKPDKRDASGGERATSAAAKAPTSAATPPAATQPKMGVTNAGSTDKRQ